MKNDMGRVRDAWQAIVNQKDLALQKLQTEMAFKVSNLREEIRMQVFEQRKEYDRAQADELSSALVKLKQMESSHLQRVERLQSETVTLDEHQRVLKSQKEIATREH